MEQMAMILRFFDKEKGSVREESVVFSKVNKTTGEELANAFLENLRNLGVTIDKLRGQCYDGAANMSGEELKENDEAKASMEKRQKLQTLCETRWASRANALFTFKASLEVIDDALHRLANMSDTKARVYTCSIERFDFILPLIVCEHVLQILAPLSEMLQSKASDLIEAMKETRAVYAVIQNERNYGTVWDALYESAVQLAATIGTFSADIPAQAAVFHTEIKRWIARWSLEDPGNLPSTLQSTLHGINPNLYPNIFNVLSVLISMPVSTASAERSFSVMRRVKSYLRSTMTTERLSGLAMLHAHKDMGVDTEAVVRDFAQGKSRRLVFLFNN
ncbi:uncharacterized protein LOC130047879 [Ostrea edulis]|uniref:uncharacterized protein LOC130047879 n=1 Tax=Ostrea edulis TaxID=37623 RepID=UPI0024AF749A|nr:uncharacterized protein LOC130047879 [Ostrea edulis]